MYNIRIPEKGSLQCNDSVEGETIEAKVRRIMESGEPITDGAPPIYTERKQGIHPETNIRTDRFDWALEATDLITKQKKTKREEYTTNREKAAEKPVVKTPEETKG
nr:MAG: hypothetical protein [Microviridae sp.]